MTDESDVFATVDLSSAQHVACALDALAGEEDARTYGADLCMAVLMHHAGAEGSDAHQMMWQRLDRLARIGHPQELHLAACQAVAQVPYRWHNMRSFFSTASLAMQLMSRLEPRLPARARWMFLQEACPMIRRVLYNKTPEEYASECDDEEALSDDDSSNGEGRSDDDDLVQRQAREWSLRGLDLILPYLEVHAVSVMKTVQDQPPMLPVDSKADPVQAARHKLIAMLLDLLYFPVMIDPACGIKDVLVDQIQEHQTAQRKQSPAVAPARMSSLRTTVVWPELGQRARCIYHMLTSLAPLEYLLSYNQRAEQRQAVLLSRQHADAEGDRSDDDDDNSQDPEAEYRLWNIDGLACLMFLAAVYDDSAALVAVRQDALPLITPLLQRPVLPAYSKGLFSLYWYVHQMHLAPCSWPDMHAVPTVRNLLAIVQMAPDKKLRMAAFHVFRLMLNYMSSTVCHAVLDQLLADDFHLPHSAAVLSLLVRERVRIASDDVAALIRVLHPLVERFSTKLQSNHHLLLECGELAHALMLAHRFVIGRDPSFCSTPQHKLWLDRIAKQLVLAADLYNASGSDRAHSPALSASLAFGRDLALQLQDLSDQHAV